MGQVLHGCATTTHADTVHRVAQVSAPQPLSSGHQRFPRPTSRNKLSGRPDLVSAAELRMDRALTTRLRPCYLASYSARSAAFSSSCSSLPAAGVTVAPPILTVSCLAVGEAG